MNIRLLLLISIQLLLIVAASVELGIYSVLSYAIGFLIGIGLCSILLRLKRPQLLYTIRQGQINNAPLLIIVLAILFVIIPLILDNIGARLDWVWVLIVLGGYAGLSVSDKVGINMLRK